MRIKILQFVTTCFAGMLGFIPQVKAQNPPPSFDSTNIKVMMKRGVGLDSTYTSNTAGEFTPGRGFDVVNTDYGKLNISMYAIARYLNQMPGHQTFQDHLGRDREIT